MRLSRTKLAVGILVAATVVMLAFAQPAYALLEPNPPVIDRGPHRLGEP